MSVFKNSDGKWVASYNGTKQYFSSQSAAMTAYSQMKAGTSTTTKTSTSSGSTSTSTAPKTTVSQQDYYLKPGESITDYNTRIAGLRGDTPEELASMQASSQKYAAENPNTAFASRLTTATAPTNVSEVTSPYPTTTLPTTTPTTPGVDNAIASVAGLSAESQKLADLQKYYDSKLLELEQANQKNTQSLMDKFLGKDGENITSPGDARAQAWAETGMDTGKYFAAQEKGIKEIESLNQSYNAVVAARDQQIAQTNDKMASMNFINNQVQQIERNAAPKLNEISANINAKAATLQALQGNFAEARSFVNEAVAAATADTKFKMDMFATFYEINQDNFDRTSKIYSDAFKNQMAIAQQDYEVQLAEKQLIGEYMLKYPSAGLSMSDSLEEASRKLGSVSGGSVDLTADMKNYEYAVSQGYEGSFADWTGKGTDTSSSGFVDIMQRAIDAGATPEQAAREATMVSEATGVPVDQETITLWTTIARGLRKTVTPVQETTISAPTGTYKTGTDTSDAWTLTNIWNGTIGKLFDGV